MFMVLPVVLALAVAEVAVRGLGLAGESRAARIVLNSVFLHELVEAGLTSAIVHASKILPLNKISDAQTSAALDLIYDRPQVI